MISGVDIKDRHKAVLLAGFAKSNRHLYDIVQPEYFEEVREEFGDCELTKAFEYLCSDDMSDVFLMNVENLHGYMKAAQLIREYDFAYVVPLDLMLSDSFYDPTQNGRKTYYAQYLAQQKAQNIHSLYLINDAHASLYEDIDAFLEDMKQKRNSFKNNLLSNSPYDDIIFVANNIESLEWSNVELAKMIRNTTPSIYPRSSDNPTAVFDIDFTDSVGDMAYFKYHMDGTLTVENLLTLYPYEEPLKVFTIYRICLYIGRELDFSEHIGVKYTPYRKKMAQQIVEEYLTSIKGKLITDYEIASVYAVLDEYHPGTVKIILKYKISPIGFDERFIEREVVI